ncbi:MAG TPA: MBL fold metallo-hydrolase [Solirubrobacteraceae bacterium]|nr:MBL fold metallo-hydrolase [Solirubrobacteraceae bacterium]
MQVVSLHEDVIVMRSMMWQVTCTLVHQGDETFVVDSPVFQDELDALPAILGQAGWRPSGLLATHGDWDHVMGRLAFPDATLGVAETTAARLRAEPGAAQRSIREFDEENYVERPRPLSLGQVQALPVPGGVGIGDRELELIPADGHTQDGMAIWIPWARILLAGDYLLPVEIPWLQEHGSASAYLATLGRLKPYVERADWVVPGHGAPLDAQRALAIMREDVAYLQALPSADAPLPPARRTARQKRLHAENVAKLAGAGS